MRRKRYYEVRNVLPPHNKFFPSPFFYQIKSPEGLRFLQYKFFTSFKVTFQDIIKIKMEYGED